MFRLLGPLSESTVSGKQVDLTILEVDQLDADTLACIVGQNPEGTLPVQPPVPRLQQLLAQSHQLVALVSDPGKVRKPQSAATHQHQSLTFLQNICHLTSWSCMSSSPVKAVGWKCHGHSSSEALLL